jgi:hypothetical protein
MSDGEEENEKVTTETIDHVAIDRWTWLVFRL